MSLSCLRTKLKNNNIFRSVPSYYSTFQDNHASPGVGQGGGLFAASSKVEFMSSVFNGNDAFEGGAAYCTEDSSVVSYSSSIQYSSVSGSGAGFYVS